jgi:hypothetical protein
LTEEHRLRIFKTREVRRISGTKRDKVTGEWRRLNNKELYALYSLPHIVPVIKSRRMRWAGHVACIGERRDAYKVFVEKPEGHRLLEKTRCRWEDNFKMELWLLRKDSAPRS